MKNIYILSHTISRGQHASIKRDMAGKPPKFPSIDVEFLPKDVRVKPCYKHTTTDLRFTDPIYNDPRHTPDFHTLSDISKSKEMARYHKAIMIFFKKGPTSEAGHVSIDVVVYEIREQVKGLAYSRDIGKKSLAAQLRKCTLSRVRKALFRFFVSHFKTFGMRGLVRSLIEKGWGRFYIRDDNHPVWYELIEEVTGIDCV